MTTIDDQDRDEVDERIALLLKELAPDSAMNDLQFERLAKRIAASATQEMQRQPQVTQEWQKRSNAVRWHGGLISAGLAAGVALVLMFVHTSSTGQPGVSWRSLMASAEQEAARDERGDLFAASIGAVSEHDYIVNLWDKMDAEVLLTRSERQ
jgi:hypothetical protein